VILVANDKSAEVLKPSKQAFDLPSTFVPTQRPPVLGGRPASLASMRSYHLDASLLVQPTVQAVAIVGLVADHSRGQIVEEAGVQRRIDKGYFVGASAACVNGERKTVSVCKAHDFGAFAAFGLAHTSAPFLAGANVPSMNPSLRSMPPRSRRSSAKAVRILSNTPDRIHCWNRRWHVLRGGYRSGRSFQGAPVRRIQRIPLSTERGSCGGRPDRPGRALGSGMNSAIRCHCSFVMSMNPISVHRKHLH